MISSIIKYELKDRLKQPLFYVFLLLMVFQSIWFIQGAYEHYENEFTLMNGSTLFYKSFAGGGHIMVIIIAIITGGVLFKDIQQKSAGIIYAFPISEKQFFISRFTAAFLINAILSFGIVIGMILTPYSGIGSPDKFGAMPWGPMVQGFFLLTLPNIFLLTAISFASLVFFRKMVAGYLGIFIISFLYMVSETVRVNATNVDFLKIIDPFTYVYTVETLDTVASNAKNTAYLTLGPLYFLNKAIWFGGSVLMLYLAYRKFTFKSFITAVSKRKKKEVLEIGEDKPEYLQSNKSSVHFTFTAAEYFRKLLRLTAMHFKSVFRPMNFKVILGLVCLLFFLQNLLWNNSFYLGAQMPTTASMTLSRVVLGVGIMILLMIWAGQLFFKERIANTWQITDALPIPVWVSQFSKFLAMSGIALVLAIALMLCGIFAQIIRGGADQIDWALYMSDFLGYKWGWLTYVLNIAIVFFLSGITGNRYLAITLSVGYYLFNLISVEQGIIEQIRFTYTLVPGIEDYSEINGYGMWNTASFWFFLMWATLAAVFVLFGIYFWKRGTTLNLKRKFSLASRQLNISGKIAVVVLLVGFFFLQSYIIKNVNDKGNFESVFAQRSNAASYEKDYHFLLCYPQPKIQSALISMDFYPEKRKATCKAELAIVNTTGKKIDSLYLSLPEFTSLTQVQFDNAEVSPFRIDEELRVAVIAQKISPNDSLVVIVETEKSFSGFTQGGNNPQPQLMANGSFMDIREILPVLGYDESRELTANRERKDFGLKPLDSRQNPVGSLKEHQNEDYFSLDALHRVKGEFTISTSIDQTVIAPGKKVKEWEANNRLYVHSVLENPGPLHWYFGSVRYTAVESNIKPINLKIFHHPAHYYNIAFYERAVANTHRFMEEAGFEYPYQELRLMEIPYYQDQYYAFANVIAISEKEGWVADTAAISDRAYMLQTIAAQMFRQTLNESLIYANVEGAEMLKTALPEALAFQVVQSYYGTEGVDEIIVKKNKAYVKDRGYESNSEKPLVRADGAKYLEANKGAIALYAISEIVGQEHFNQAVLNWSKVNNNQEATFASLYKVLLSKIPQDKKPDIREMFEEVSDEPLI